MAFQKQTARFTGVNNSALDVLARSGKTGISVFVRVREQGKRAVTGCRNVFLPANEAAAQAKFDELVQQSAARGWTRKTVGGGGAAASAFSEIPLPTALPASEPLKAKTGGGTKKTDKGKK